jgi:precorrin-6A/cobalt-precorrin-6A reductase
MERLLPMPRKILILGGTADARRLAEALVAKGHDVTTSLAGVTSVPEAIAGTVRRGGFGGSTGLRAFLLTERFDVLIDATHPFAEVISRNAHDAIEGLNITHMLVTRAPWTAMDGDRWRFADTCEEAVAALPAQAYVFAAVGRKQAHLIFARGDISGVLRSIEMPDVAVPKNWVHVVGRPSASVAVEAALLRSHRVSHLICKDSGGEGGRAKLLAARLTGVDVILIRRPVKSSRGVVGDVDHVLRHIGVSA